MRRAACAIHTGPCKNGSIDFFRSSLNLKVYCLVRDVCVRNAHVFSIVHNRCRYRCVSALTQNYIYEILIEFTFPYSILTHIIIMIFILVVGVPERPLHSFIRITTGANVIPYSTTTAISKVSQEHIFRVICFKTTQAIGIGPNISMCSCMFFHTLAAFTWN